MAVDKRGFKQSLAATLEVSVILAALATIPLTVVQERGASGPLMLTADWIIWSVFLIEFLVMATLARDHSKYIKRNWLSPLIVVLSFPLLPGVLALTRLARLVRLARVFRLAVVTTKTFRSLKNALGRRALLGVIGILTLLVLVGGGLIAVVEPETVRGGYWSGIWWAIVTVTTVGYGDISPQTVAGRLIAVTLMLGGIGLVASLAASLAAFFVEQDEKTEGFDIEAIEVRLTRIEVLLQQLATKPDPEIPRASSQLPTEDP